MKFHPIKPRNKSLALISGQISSQTGHCFWLRGGAHGQPSTAEDMAEAIHKNSSVKLIIGLILITWFTIEDYTFIFIFIVANDT